MSPEQLEIIDRIKDLVKEKFRKEGSGHDWFHIERVLNMSVRLAAEEQCDVFVVQLGALLHDIADHKFHPDDPYIGQRIADEIMLSLGVDALTRKKVVQIVAEISYKGSGVPTPMSTIEGAVVQDADRLDAIGAIGIARAFAYGGSKHRMMYDPEELPVQHQDFDHYRKSEGTTINHFYEKLLLLKDRMNTDTAGKIAEERHAFMELWLARFFEEWQGRE
jgi:uncharacterized protein